MATKKGKAPRGSASPRLFNAPIKGDKSAGKEIAELAERIGQPLLPWQKYVFDDYLTKDKKGNFIRRSGLLILPRQNGKTHLAKMRVIWGLFMGNERNHLIMSSNRSMALTSFRDIAYTIESHDFLKDSVKQIRYANGTESIELKNGARLDVVAATRDGSRGRSASFLWIDELREVDEEAYAAALPTTRAILNSQSLYTSNAGDAFSTVLNTMREKALSYPPKTLGYYEWSAPQYCKLDDVNAWYISNPSLGYLIDEEAIREAMTMQSVEQFRTETLSQWIDSLQSPWPHGAWEALADNTLQMSEGAYTIFAFDKSPSARHASLVAGQILPDGRIGLALVNTWENAVAIDELRMAADIKAWCDQYRPRKVLYDKYTCQTIADRLTNSGVMCEDLSGARFYQACGDFLDSIVNKRIVHAGQDIVHQQMNNCAAKTNDAAWRIVRRKSAGDVTAPIGLAMVVHELLKPQATPQIII